MIVASICFDSQNNGMSFAFVSPNSIWGKGSRPRFPVSRFIRQSVLLSALLAAWCIQGGAARAGYVSVAELGDQDNANCLSPWNASPFAERDASAAVADTDALRRSDAETPHAPTPPLAPFGKLPDDACTFGHGSGAGSSSTAGSGPSPSNTPLGDLTRPQVPPVELASLLPPPTGDASPFSVASFLFRPPRAR